MNELKRKQKEDKKMKVEKIALLINSSFPSSLYSVIGIPEEKFLPGFI